MKKFLIVLVAIMAIFAIVGCNNGTTSSPTKTRPPVTAVENLEITDAAEIGALLTAQSYFNDTIPENEGSPIVKAEANKAIFNFNDTVDPTGSDNFGFKLDFPEGVEAGHLSLEVTFKLVEVKTVTGGFGKIGFKSAKGSGDVTPYDDHEVVFGNADNVGKEFVQSFSLLAPNKLPNKAVWFNHNKYGDAAKGTNGSAGKTQYTIEITQLLFKGGAIAKKDLTKDDFTVTGLDQEVDKVVAVTVKAKDGIDAGTITVSYDPGGATVPQALGSYKVIIAATGSAGYKAVTGLEVGTLVVSPPYAGGATSIGAFNITNSGTQKGWEFGTESASVIDFAKIETAKALVLKGVNAGTNGDGFGGIDTIFQPLPSKSGWEQTGLNDGWTNKPGADPTSSTAYVVILLNSSLAGFDDFIAAEGGNFFIQSNQIDAYTEGYLLGGIPTKPADAVDMVEGGVTYGFITADASILD